MTTLALQNWARNHAYPATALHEPTSVEMLQDVVAGARRVRAVGTRHCFNSIVDAPELVSLERMPRLMEIDTERRTVRVAAATRYGTLAEHLQAHGWAVHNLASLPHISVAGAVATATHGSGDRLPNLAAVVAGLEMVTASGEIVVLTRQDAELAGSVVGLGALGVVTAVTLDIEPTYDVIQQVHTGLRWSAALENFDAITASADSVSLFTRWGSDVGQVWRKTRVPPGGLLEDGDGAAHVAGLDRAASGGPVLTGTAGTWAAAEELGAAPATERLHMLTGNDPSGVTEQLGVPGPWHERLPHFRMDFTPSYGEEIQSEYFVDRRHAVAAIEALRGLAGLTTPVLYTAEIRTVAADDLWMSMAYGQDSVGLHFSWRPMQPEVEAVLPAVEAALQPFSPRAHWGKVFLDTDRTMAGRYPRVADFRALVARRDPEGKFRNAFLDRHVLGDEG